MSDIWELFPYPTLNEDTFTPGSLMDVHPDCMQCPTRDCALAPDTSSAARQCRFGLTYARVDSQRTITGLVASDAPSPSARARRRFKNEPDRRVKTSHIEAAATRAKEMGPGVSNDFTKSKQEILDHLVRDPTMHRQLAEDLRRGFDQSFNQSHDFLQLIQLVKGHSEALLFDKRPDLDAETAAETLPIEGAIYFSTQLMVLKLDSLLYLQEINMALGSEKSFRVHSLILKYVRIYNWQAKQKQLVLAVTGNSYAMHRCNATAFGAIVQGILDNMIKYAPAGSKADVHFEESETSIIVRFSSLGPRIESSERAQIFFPGFRASAAKALESSGQGIGLAAAKRVADALNLILTVDQESTENDKYARRHLTTFSLKIPKP